MELGPSLVPLQTGLPVVSLVVEAWPQERKSARAQILLLPMEGKTVLDLMSTLKGRIVI
jgi:hypothetical protein